MSKLTSSLGPGSTSRRIENWRLLKTYRALHLFGLFPPHRRFWVTAAIVALDVAERVAVTEDGVTYHLAGEPGSTVFAARFVALCAAFDERLEGTRDVTDTLLGEACVQSLFENAMRAGRHPVTWQ
ncbi:hypothetical protein SAMN05216345_10356 [Cupriavidus sp. YR651]|uniref:hypothetical protein n=1 Tax=Cupriavidus sp. YR651 TaxID=1855315 RepID=UPI00087EA586|nr:hypothetical protein [Cupriavidus sp. YR651]SDC62637.1 hypothetical protein SAMN05216345_10356 [Cupriavidus sp. YR651]